jgi:hypothetical protein
MARPKLKNVKRDKTTGRSRGERPEDVMSVGMAARIKFAPDATDALEMIEGDALNNLRGFTLGVLLCRWRACNSDPSGISQRQYDAGDKYAKCIARHARLMEIPPPSAKSGSFIMVSNSDWLYRSNGDLPSEPESLAKYLKDAADLRAEFRNYRKALLQAGAAIGQGSRVNAITYAVCVDNIPADSLSETDIGNLRVGLNALARVG